MTSEAKDVEGETADGRTIAVVSAGLGQPSSTRLLADRLASAAVDALRGRGVEAEAVAVDLRDHAHQMVDAMLTGFTAGALRDAVDTVVGADGLVAVTPVFNASYSGLFKTFFDVLERGSLDGMPVLIGATGGTARHSLVLEHAVRPMFAYMRAVVAPTAVYAAAEDWGSGRSGGVDGLSERVARAGAELASLVAARAPAAARRDAADADPYAHPVPFERLLASGGQ
ncbi:FMN reductase [Actinomadura rubrobrunea]|uniref:FMN reductase n=1 Tax=Actinomadura rubrobrunea TaxID=115335 RepID=A0A9W6UZG6_9ACTN|nr:FMN reductase [Actinomadura rubrobrunea]GLW66755.1 FMN reductase [Actinomadura rubrobrunea]